MNHAAVFALRLMGPLIKIDYFRSMEAIRQIIEKASVPLVVDIPDAYKDRKVEVIVMPLDELQEQPKQKYDFSDLVGKLEWKGDAVAEQRKLRNEWD